MMTTLTYNLHTYLHTYILTFLSFYFYLIIIYIIVLNRNISANMATDAENMKDIEYIDEELDDIEYTEILSFEEMSKINPSFIALDKEEIYNHLYNFFKDKKKSGLIRSLFYEILSNRDSKNGKISDYTNYIFNVEGELEKYGDDNSKDATYNFIEKYNKNTGFSEFVKRRFCVSYDRKSDLHR